MLRGTRPGHEKKFLFQRCIHAHAKSIITAIHVNTYVHVIFSCMAEYLVPLTLHKLQRCVWLYMFLLPPTPPPQRRVGEYFTSRIFALIGPMHL